MSIQRAALYVDGMTCPACEARISKSLLAIEGVIRAEARLQGGKESVEYDDKITDRQAIEAAIEKAGYAVRAKKNPGTTLALGIGLLLAAAYLLAGSSGVFNALPRVDASIGYAMLFVVGLLTSIHCVAMCGGIALSQSVRRLEPSSTAAVERDLNSSGPDFSITRGGYSPIPSSAASSEPSDRLSIFPRRRKASSRALPASAVLVMFLGIVTFGRAAALAGIALPGLPSLSLSTGRPSSAAPSLNAADRGPSRGGMLTATLAGEAQTVVTEFKDGYYVPFAVQAGVPLKWIIRIKAEDINGCNNPMVIPACGIKKELAPGDNLVEFTPKKEGAIAYSCWMGMIPGYAKAVDDVSKVDIDKVRAEIGSYRASGGAGGCCGVAPIAKK